jgi:DNA adenine methylase
VRPPVAYFGGKGRLAPWIASLLPAHRVYVEPFCGSAAVLFAKAPSTHEVINDRYGDLVCFLRILRERPDEMELACRLTPYARDEYVVGQVLAELRPDGQGRHRVVDVDPARQ